TMKGKQNSKIFQIYGTCNNYSWGKVGTDSLAARLCAKTPGIPFEIDNDEHYSELWFGDYPDFPAKDLKSEETLEKVLQDNKQQLLGTHVLQKLDGQLPFLPKILSINKALPLQIHPDKQLAARLHQEQPDKFTDPNHKPEIAVALSKFEVFAGWKSVNTMSALFAIPALRRFVPDRSDQWTSATIRKVVVNLLTADENAVQDAEFELLQQPRGELQDLGEQGYILDLLPRLQQQYSSRDPGSLVALLCMNYMILSAGEAIYIPADGIHAYLSGDIVECMARSNNVLNTGFCPAPDRDNIELFAKALTFTTTTETDGVRLPSTAYKGARNGLVSIYKPPISEFDMLCVDLGAYNVEYLNSHAGPAVAIVTKGKGKLITDEQEVSLEDGFIYYIAPGVATEWRAQAELQVYVAVSLRSFHQLLFLQTMSSELNLQCAVVTGGGGGIGKEIARWFLSQGKKCIIVGRTEEKLEKTAKEINATGYYVLDTGKTDECHDFVKRITTAYPEVDCLVNNAGVQRPLEILKTEDFLHKADEEIDINIRGPMHLTMGLLPHFEAKEHALIINISSMLGFLPSSIINPVYNGTKSWIHFWSLNLRSQLEGRHSRTRVVEIAPPQVETDLHRERDNPDDNKKDNSPSSLSLKEFMEEITKKLENGDDCISAGPGNDAVDKWYNTYGDAYKDVASKWVKSHNN
ncbi:hypothetical protein Golomagni_05891, partial [Golovinomyces magnicellulatus]